MSHDRFYRPISLADISAINLTDVDDVQDLRVQANARIIYSKLKLLILILISNF